MQLQSEIDDCPSFSCYFSNSLTATAAAKVSREFNQEQIYEFTDFVDEQDFEFSLELSHTHQVSPKHIDLHHPHFVFPVFESAPLTNGELDLNVEEIDDTSSSSSISIQLHKLDIDEHEEITSSSSSSSEADHELEGKRSGIFCMWRLKTDVVSSSPVTNCKKSNSTGSRSHGSKRWRIRNLLRRSNSEGEDSRIFLESKKIENTKQKRNVDQSKDVAEIAGGYWSAASSPSFHELFYVQKRAQQKNDKFKSFLPYKQDLLGFFVNINRNRHFKL